MGVRGLIVNIIVFIQLYCVVLFLTSILSSITHRRLVIDYCNQPSKTHLPKTHNLSNTLRHMITDVKHIIRKTQNM